MRLLIAGSAFQKDEHIRFFNALGIETICIDREDETLNDEVYNADAVICNWLFVHHDIKRFTNLRYIQLLSAGTDRVPIVYIKEHNIVLNNARGVYSIPMAEFVVSGVLQLIKHSSFFYEQKRACIWEKKRDITELSNKKILIVGAGSVGSETAKRFAAFTDEVYGIDVYVPKKYNWFKDIFDISKLNQMLADSDIVILTLPLNDKTYHLFNKKQFSFMKRGAILVNIARGGVVDENALIDALDGYLSGAVLDVFEQEPLSADSPFWKMDNVILSPHNSFVSDQNNKRLWELCKKNIEAFLGKSGDGGI